MIKEAIKHYLEANSFAEFAPRVVLFDMDGVLYNSMPNHAVAWHEAMKQFGIHFTADDSYATEGARGVDTIRRYVLKQQGREISPEEAQRMYDVKTEIFHRMPIAEIFPGVIDIMQKIKSAGMTIGVVTGSGQRPLIKRLLTDFDVAAEPARTPRGAFSTTMPCQGSLSPVLRSPMRYGSGLGLPRSTSYAVTIWSSVRKPSKSVSRRLMSGR